MEIKSINLKSMFKLGFFFYLAVMMVVGVIGLLFMIIGLVTNFSTGSLTAALGAVVIYIIIALFYGLVAALFLSLSGFVYNKLAAKFGGIKIDVGEVK